MPTTPDNQSSMFGVPDRLASLIVREHESDLSPAELDELREALKLSAPARELYVRWGLQAEVLAEALRPAYDEGSAEGSSADVPALHVVEASEKNYPDLLAELVRMEAKASVIALPIKSAEEAPEHKDDPNALLANDFKAAGAYLLSHTLTPKRLAVMATAAVVLLGAVLAIVLLGGPDPTPNSAQTPDDPMIENVSIVATLTAEYDAVWYRRPGEELRAGQRLNLIAGFAEIMTNDGAIAILEAPATIELTDSDNAIRLHSGKLVGKCETPQSKGFVVHVPGMDVVDLGTEFGIEADAEVGSTVLVIGGSVRAKPSAESPRAFKPLVLKKDEARRIQPETGSLEVIAVSEAPVFHSQVPHAYVRAVLDAGPVAYWRFEDDTDKTIDNVIDPSRDGLKMVGPATLTDAGVIGKAGLLANRAEPYGYFETSNPIDRLNGFDTGTIEFWYYADQHNKRKNQHERALLISMHDTGNALLEPGVASAEMFAIELNDDTLLFDQAGPATVGGGQHAVLVSPGLFLDGQQRRILYTDHDHPVQQWQHVVLVKQKDTITLYLDGKPVEEMPHAFGPINPASIRLGHTYTFDALTPQADSDRVSPKSPLMGRLDEVALYDKPLTAEQVARHHALATSEEISP